MSHNRISVLLLVVLSLQLLSTTTAIGGWDPIHILMNRMSEGRSAHQQQQQVVTDESTRVSSSKLQSKKKNDVVNASSSSKQQRRTSTTSSNKGKEAFVPQNQRQRRGFVPRGDVEDANSIEFVRRSNPFL